MVSDEEQVKARANDPVVLPLFEELGKLLGKDASEPMRIATAKGFPNAGLLVTYLKKRITEEKKKQAAAQAATTAAITTTATQVSSATTEKPAVHAGENLMG